jgi:hypothetical protein
MRSGNFGSPPTENSVRDKLCSFQQRKQSGQWNTPRHLSKMFSIIQQSINRPNDHTLIWLVQRSLHPQLQSKMQLTANNKLWESFADYCSKRVRYQTSQQYTSELHRHSSHSRESRVGAHMHQWCSCRHKLHYL